MEPNSLKKEKKKSIDIAVEYLGPIDIKTKKSLPLASKQ